MPSIKNDASRRGDTVALVLQGGGALGAFQAGAFEAMCEASRSPDWVAGISIGAINAALIAGNPPERRVERLHAFWDGVTAGVPSLDWAGESGPVRDWLTACASIWGAAFGLPSFFTPRPGAALWPGEVADPSLYDTEPLRRTLSALVDFNLLNDGPVRLSVGAVDVESGNFNYFDSHSQRIGPEHIMASGALPPGFPAVRVDGHDYWDGGLVSNTPLSHVIDHLGDADATIFQVDLFSARGEVPRTLAQVAEREKDIRFSSRTRAVTDRLREQHELHRRLRTLAALLPANVLATPEVQALLAGSRDNSVTLVHLIHRHKGFETQSKDYEFSRTSMLEHWQSGRRGMAHSIASLAETPTRRLPGSFEIFDYTPDHTKEPSHESR